MSATRASMPQKECSFSEKGKVINDPIHGPMYFHEILLLFIDTEHFQRLRDIKQLGATSYVYPGGVHTRFEHSLGVCHLTGILFKFLKERNPEFAHLLTEERLLCLEIAALCHDLGHGPLSRVYQDQFLRRLKDTEWGHNATSVAIFESIIQEDRVKQTFEKYNIKTSEIEFIKHAMVGRIPEEKNRFLYEIVKNRRNGIDCNVFDSILRDCYYVGVKSAFNYRRIMENFKICKVKDQNRLCIRYKERLAVRELYYSSWALQSLVYTHKTTRAIEMMFAEAMYNADSHFEISEAKDNPEKLMKLSDNIIYRILFEDDKGDQKLKEAKMILKRINERKLYQFCGQTSLKPLEGNGIMEDDSEDSGVEGSPASQQLAATSRPRRCSFPPRRFETREHHQICKQVAKQIAQWPKLKIDITEGEIFVEVISIIYGDGKNDPLENIDFINKEGTLVDISPGSMFQEDRHFVNSFNDQYIRVYCRDASDEVKKQEIQNRFYKWCCEKKYDVPKDMEKVPIEHDDWQRVSPPFPAARRLDFDEAKEGLHQIGIF